MTVWGVDGSGLVGEKKLKPLGLKCYGGVSNPKDGMLWHVHNDDNRKQGKKIDNIKIVSNLPADNAGSEVPSVISGLYSNYPNPFNPTTNIKFGLKNDSHVNISIYNVRGQKVKTLIDNEMESGIHQEIWNGTDDKGSTVSSGIYFYKFKADSRTETKKMILMK